MRRRALAALAVLFCLCPAALGHAGDPASQAGRAAVFSACGQSGTGVVLNPGESYYPYQWALKNNGNFRRSRLDDEGSPGAAPSYTGSEAQGGIDINVEPAWEIYEAGSVERPVTVALIDTGVDVAHPDLASSIWINEDEIPGDGIDNDGNGYVDDWNGWNFCSDSPQVFAGEEDSHGTHSAGTIAGAWDGQGITGIADGAYVKVMVLKVFGQGEGQGIADNVKKAIYYAQDNGADICNLSIESRVYDEELEALIQASPMLFVVSAGNGADQGIGTDIDREPVYPAAYSGNNVITVANLMFDGTLDENSNYGAESVDIAAPGTYILGAVPGGYGFMSGTSMAAPMVSGTAALVCSCRPDLDLLEVREAVVRSARKLDALSGKTASGGMLDAYGAITYRKAEN